MAGIRFEPVGDPFGLQRIARVEGLVQRSMKRSLDHQVRIDGGEDLGAATHEVVQSTRSQGDRGGAEHAAGTGGRSDAAGVVLVARGVGEAVPEGVAPGRTEVHDAEDGESFGESRHQGSRRQGTRSEGLAIGLPRVGMGSGEIGDDPPGGERISVRGRGCPGAGLGLDQRVQQVLPVGPGPLQFRDPG